MTKRGSRAEESSQGCAINLWTKRWTHLLSFALRLKASYGKCAAAWCKIQRQSTGFLVSCLWRPSALGAAASNTEAASRNDGSILQMCGMLSAAQ